MAELSSSEYERLASAELEAASTATSEAALKHHLNEAARYAHLSEQCRVKIHVPNAK